MCHKWRMHMPVWKCMPVKWSQQIDHITQKCVILPSKEYCICCSCACIQYVLVYINNWKYSILSILHYYNHYSAQSSLRDYYVDELSVTHGNPRIHVLTFAAELSKVPNFLASYPCSLNPGLTGPTFLGENYFCESSISGGFTNGVWWYGMMIHDADI